MDLQSLDTYNNKLFICNINVVFKKKISYPQLFLKKNFLLKY